MLEERIKQPLQGNLALSFLFKDQDLSDIIKQKVSEEESPVTRQTIASLGLDADQELDLTKIPGYYRNKHSHTVVTAHDFMQKIRKTGVLTKYFSSPDPEFAGIRIAFDSFYEKLTKHLQNDESMAKDHKMQLHEIHEVIMFQLHQEFFCNQSPSVEEKMF